MHQYKNVLDCYNKTAKAYAQNFYEELADKPFDRLMLQRLAQEHKNEGSFLDLGIGPGQTTQYLHQLGIKELIGTDLSPEMIKIAQELNPNIHFEVANILDLAYANNNFRAITAFYAIVHFNYDEIVQALSEIYRILQPKGQFLFSFHVGEEEHHLKEFLEQDVDICFYYFELDKVLEIAHQQEFKPVETIIRYPYLNVEYPSKRAYILLEK